MTLQDSTLVCALCPTAATRWTGETLPVRVAPQCTWPLLPRLGPIPCQGATPSRHITATTQYGKQTLVAPVYHYQCTYKALSTYIKLYICVLCVCLLYFDACSLLFCSVRWLVTCFLCIKGSIYYVSKATCAVNLLFCICKLYYILLLFITNCA